MAGTNVKDATKGKEEEVKDVALATQGGAVAEFMDMSDFGGHSGFEGADAESYAIPFLQILQKMSPLVDEDSAKYVQGAKAGMIYNTVTGRLYDGKAGILIIPCAYRRSFIRWGGREAENKGFKGVLTVEQFRAIVQDPTKVKEVDRRYFVPNEDGSVNEKKNDYYADTREHFVIVIDPETGEFGNAILSLASSQIKASKKLMTSLSQKKVQTPQGMKTPPTFANLVRLSTIAQSNDQGTWSGAGFELEGLVSDKGMYESAKAFYSTIIAGEANVDYNKADAASSGGDGVGEATEAEGF
jgi:hypothetical protein